MLGIFPSPAILRTGFSRPSGKRILKGDPAERSAGEAVCSPPGGSGDRRPGYGGIAVAQSVSSLTWARASLAVSLCMGTILGWVCGCGLRANAQTRDSNPKEDIVNVLMTAPRELEQRLARLQEGLADERALDAAANLGELVAALGSDDFFQAAPNLPTVRGVRWEIRRLFRSLSAAQRAAYEELFGPRAARLLDEAVAARDEAKLEAAATIGYGTEAGRQAMLLLGRWRLDHNQPLEASGCFLQLVDTRAAQTDYEPELSGLLAVAWLKAAIPEKARESLARLRRTHPDTAIRLHDRTVKLFSAADPLSVLAPLVKASSGPGLGLRAEWLVYGGDACRSGSAGGELASGEADRASGSRRVAASADPCRRAVALARRSPQPSRPASPSGERMRGRALGGSSVGDRRRGKHSHLALSPFLDWRRWRPRGKPRGEERRPGRSNPASSNRAPGSACLVR